MRSSTKPGPYGWAVRRVLHSPLRLQTRPGLLIAVALVSDAQLFRSQRPLSPPTGSAIIARAAGQCLAAASFLQRVSMRIPQPFLAVARFALPRGGV